MNAREPITLAIPLTKRIKEFIITKKRLPDGEWLREVLKGLELEEIYSNRGLSILRNRWLVVLVFPRENGTVVDVIPTTGELSEGLEIVLYHDRALNSLIVEILPASDLEYEGNIGLEPVIVNAETGELESVPVLGDFREDEEGIFLVIDGETYERWGESGKLDVCPICGGRLVWKGKRAFCTDCGYGVEVKE
jgi:hypothetical protein